MSRRRSRASLRSRTRPDSRSARLRLSRRRAAEAPRLESRALRPPSAMTARPEKPRTEPRVPVLTIDGPSGSGKGTISRAVAEALGWHLLDSGAIYRAVGFAAGEEGIDLSDAKAVTRCAETTKIVFRDPKDGGETRVIVNG